MIRQNWLIVLIVVIALTALAATRPARSTTTRSSRSASRPATTQVGELYSEPVPFLSPQDAAKTFNLPDGFRAEVVASEPMVQHPVAMTFDPDGRIWVVEMRGYMPTPEGKGEDQPNGR